MGQFGKVCGKGGRIFIGNHTLSVDEWSVVSIPSNPVSFSFEEESGPLDDIVDLIGQAAGKNKKISKALTKNIKVPEIDKTIHVTGTWWPAK